MTWTPPDPHTRRSVHVECHTRPVDWHDEPCDQCDGAGSFRISTRTETTWHVIEHGPGVNNGAPTSQGGEL